MLAIFLDNLIPTLEKFKQIIRILIQEVNNLYLELQNKDLKKFEEAKLKMTIITMKKRYYLTKMMNVIEFSPKRKGK